MRLRRIELRSHRYKQWALTNRRQSHVASRETTPPQRGLSQFFFLPETLVRTYAQVRYEVIIDQELRFVKALHYSSLYIAASIHDP